MTDKEPTFAEDLKAEAEALRRRLVHHTRPQSFLTFDEAIALSKRLSGDEPR